MLRTERGEVLLDMRRLRVAIRVIEHERHPLPEEGRGGGAFAKRSDVGLRRTAQHDGGQLVGLGEEVERGAAQRA